MDGERITLRLETEDLELIDEFVEKRPEFSNRSHLARVAIRAYIEGANGSPASEERGARVTVEVPRAVLHILSTMVKEGYYNSIGGAIEETIRKEFVTKEHLEDAKRRALEARKSTPEYIP
jgi:Arc/MetJ-type ribon-helix-helix transcriptional regulator